MKKQYLIIFIVALSSPILMFGQNPNTSKDLLTPPKNIGLSSKSSFINSNRTSEYLKFEKKIISWTIQNNIPVNTPKHKIGQSKKEYAFILLDWFRKNSSLLNKESAELFKNETRFNELLRSESN